MKTKALFILHEGIFIYGANRSMAGLLQNIDYDYDLMICKSFTKKIDEAQLREMFGKHLKTIYIVWMPRYRCQDYARVSLFSELSHVVNNVMAYFGKKIRQQIIRNGHYSYVHLNSLVLFPVIDDNARYIIHAREVINPEYRGRKKLIDALERASGIIYIDEATRIPIEKLIKNRRRIVLNNPFDMTNIAKTDYESSLKKYGLSETDTVFAMLGQVLDYKGSKFVIRSFMDNTNENSRLLIVGNHKHSYGQECIEMAGQDKRVLFCGELKDTGSIYRVSDYILRGDPQFCVGRTIYEGLFSGSGVIIPGCRDDLSKMAESEKFKDKIHFYEPGNAKALTDAIEKCVGQKQENREFRSNIEDYIEQYKGFLSKTLLVK